MLPQGKQYIETDRQKDKMMRGTRAGLKKLKKHYFFGKNKILDFDFVCMQSKCQNFSWREKQT
jgi:hypothetical protein